jgi:hypothetical protein
MTIPHSALRTPHSRRRTGKIARLPHHLQEQVNLMLLDGIPYAAILKALGEHGKGINYHSLKRWRKGGYQDWLRARERLEIARILQPTPNPAKLPEALANQIGLQMFQFLVDLEPSFQAQTCGPDMNTLTRVANALPGLRKARKPDPA